MMEKIDSPRRRDIYSRRMEIVEPVFDHIKVQKTLLGRFGDENLDQILDRMGKRTTHALPLIGDWLLETVRGFFDRFVR